MSRTRGRRLRRLGAAVGVTLLAVSVVAHAGTRLNTIDTDVQLSRAGAHAAVHGPLACTSGERVALRLTLTQRSTGAHGRGRWRDRCTGEVERWAVTVVARRGQRFEPGPAFACALATTRTRGRRTDAHQWCRDVTVDEPAARSAGTWLNTIDAEAAIRRRGREVRTGGPIGCDAGERVSVRLTYAQRSTGALAEATWRGRCTGSEQRWSVRLRARGRERFAPGPVEAVAFALTRAGGRVTDAHQWSREVTLQ